MSDVANDTVIEVQNLAKRYGKLTHIQQLA